MTSAVTKAIRIPMMPRSGIIWRVDRRPRDASIWLMEPEVPRFPADKTIRLRVARLLLPQFFGVTVPMRRLFRFVG
ncbi:hypothetical protein LCGC14_0916560 [marine sediment metagenome]|uniref:Uncharacterized protein n=1 Tax=marine sediment metagenome TaxID=412755 RepID=A0A0F9RAX4_9ZZZZ